MTNSLRRKIIKKIEISKIRQYISITIYLIYKFWKILKCCLTLEKDVFPLFLLLYINKLIKLMPLKHMKKFNLYNGIDFKVSKGKSNIWKDSIMKMWFNYFMFLKIKRDCFCSWIMVESKAFQVYFVKVAILHNKKQSFTLNKS